MNRIIVIVVVAIGLVGLAVFLFSGESSDPGTEAAREPLYWVAPMDPNFRRDGPGKSPMGMDLVPVYAEQESGAGEVRINPAVQQNIGIKTAEVRSGRLTDEITSVGYLAFNEARLWHAYPRVEGWIDKLHVDYVGEAVESGQVLFEIYSPALIAAQEEYLSALQGGNSALIESSEGRLRTMDLPASTLELIRSSRQVQRTVSVHSPQAGIVSQLNVRDGHFVRPGTSILDVAGLEDVWVNVPVFEAQASLVGLGDGLHLYFDGLGGEVRHTTVDFVSPTIDPVSRTLEIRGTLQNPDGRLRPDMFATVVIDVSYADSAMLIPRQALIQTAGSRRVVIKLSDDTFRSVAVETGRFSDEEVEITQGLKIGERVVTSAQFLIDSESNVAADLRRMGLESDRSSQSTGSDHETMDHGAMDHDTMDHGTMDHGTMDHGTMDHGTMNHGTMNHGTMDHGTMDHGTVDHGTVDHESMDDAGGPES